MTKTLTTLLIATAAAVVAVIAPQETFADARTDALPLDQHTEPGQSPQDRYQAALDVAAQNLKKNLAQCDKLAASERAECVRQANDVHDADVANASAFLNRPR